tara:strand:+ start:1625 stop:2110 length:486 start_codon:yes stop_codon:yes gene_type:complete
MITTLNNPNDIYNKHLTYDFTSVYDIDSMEERTNKRLFATFTTLDKIDELIENVQNDYTIQYNKIFSLKIMDSEEYVLTYNVDSGNVESIPENTILLHRKKESNTLYTINALNELIKKLNNGVVDTRFKVDWNHYRNCILLTQHNSLKQLNTKIHKIIQLD